jgi:hypothetical protein
MNEVYEYSTANPNIMNDNRVFSKIPLMLVTLGMDPADIIGHFPILFNASVKVHYIDN